MNDELRFGVIGCGGIATEVHCPNLAAIPGACTWAYCDLEESKAQRLLEVHGGEYFTADAERIVDDPNIDAVLIQTGPRMHPALVQAAARAGKHVFVEKPIAIELADALATVQAVESAGVRFQHGTCNRLAPMVKQAKRMCAHPLYSYCQCTDAVTDQAVHNLDLAVNLFHEASLVRVYYIQFRRSHAKHHQYTTHHDFDLEVMLPLNFKWHAWIYGFTFHPKSLMLVFPHLFRQCFGRRREVSLRTEWERILFPASDPEGLAKMVRWARVLLLGHTALALIFVFSGNWILLFLVTFAPFFARWFGILTHVPQHIGMEPDVADWRHSTRTYLAGPFVRFFYWNMNYHVEHHMFAAVPFYNLPKLRKVLEPDLPTAPYGLLTTWREIAATLRKQKRDPTYHRPLVYPDARNAAGT